MVQCAVVILNWNGERHLREFLPSVVEHTPCEVADIVVADNGSTDGSLELLRSQFADVKVIILGQNYGFARGYNEALSELHHKYFILLNSDVKVSEGWIEPLIAELRDDESVGAVAPKLLSYSEPTQFEYAGASGGYIDILGYPFCRGRMLNHTEEDRGQYDDAKDLFWVSGAAFGCRAELFKELGGFDVDFFAHMEEIDLCWRMQLRGYRVRVVPRSVVYHLGGGTLSKTSPQKLYLNHRNNLAMLFKCAPTGQRLLVAVARPVLDFAASLSYLLQGDWRGAWAVFRAYGTFIAWHHRLFSKRKAVRSARISESQHIYRGSVVWNFFRGRKRFSDLPFE